MKNTLELMVVAFAASAFSTSATATTAKAVDISQSVVPDQDGNANAKIERTDQGGGKRECKKDSKKSCCKRGTKEGKKCYDKNANKESRCKKNGKKSCCKKGGEDPADRDAK